MMQLKIRKLQAVAIAAAAVITLSAATAVSAADFAGDDDKGMAGVITSDGKIITVGYAKGVFSRYPTFALTQHLPNGELDPDFGAGGLVVIPSGDPKANNQEFAYATAVQSDGRILAGGTSVAHKGGVVASWKLVRLNNDGSLDRSFGRDGTVTLNLFRQNWGESIQGLAIQTDGKIIAAGYAHPDLFEGVIVRFNSNGSLDKTFGNRGKVIPNSPFRSWQLRSVALQGDKIVAAGYANFAYGEGTDVVLLRLNSDGSVDTSFGIEGWALLDYGFEDKARRVAIQGDGRIVIAGSTSEDEFYAPMMMVARFEANGAIDPSFGGDGIVATSVSDWALEAEGLAIQTDGKIAVAGSDMYHSVAVRYDATGNLDPDFGVGGIFQGPFGGVNDLQLQADGHLVLFGFDYTPLTDHDFNVVRLSPDGVWVEVLE